MCNIDCFADSEARLLTPVEMARVDATAIASGMAGTALMENAGAAVAQSIMSRWAPGIVLVACGPGNNGGDGFVIARHLAAAGWNVRLAMAGSPDALHGDAAWHAQQWRSGVETLPETLPGHLDLVVDALFGAGLARPLEGVAAKFVQSLNNSKVPVCAVDIPSGVDGATGQPKGGLAVQADLTVTFCRKKPGHLLLPGRTLCGELVLADIGIPAAVLRSVPADTAPGDTPGAGASVFENSPELWRSLYPWPRIDGHKYHRGHTAVLGGGAMTGAARLGATAAARMGSGLTTLLVPQASLPLYAAAPASLMVQGWADDAALYALLQDPRKSVIVMGPGAGVSERLAAQVLHVLSLQRTTVLDADALSVYAHSPDTLFRAMTAPCVLTPHDGEFSRLFPSIASDGSKLRRARQAARESGAVVLLKGPDTVIAAPDGRAVINSNAPALLATGGAGDVLAGMIAGLAAQGMPLFEAACAAAWLHGEAARRHGPGLIADDLPAEIPSLLRHISAHGWPDSVRQWR